MLSVLLSLANIGQGGDPAARNAAFIGSATGFTFEFTVKAASIASTGKGTLVLRQPDMQRFSCAWGGESYRFVHSKAGSLAVREDWRQYDEGQAYPVNLQPEGDFSGLAEFAYPNFLLARSLQTFGRSGKREVAGKEDVRGVSCDVLKIESQEISTAGSHTFWVDPEGRVLRWHRVLMLDTGMIDTATDFVKIEKSAPSDPAFYAVKLPIGYVPASIPTPHTLTRMVSAPAVFGTWLDARRDTKVDATRQFKGKPVAMVFTAPDCAISARAEGYLVSLRRQLKSKGCALVEISLGPTKPDASKKDKDRQLFWDKDATIERAYGTPGTPYFLLADKTGTLVRGWQGYSKDMEAGITKNLLSAFDPQD